MRRRCPLLEKRDMVLGARVFVKGFLPRPAPGKVALKTFADCAAGRLVGEIPRFRRILVVEEVLEIVHTESLPNDKAICQLLPRYETREAYNYFVYPNFIFIP